MLLFTATAIILSILFVFVYLFRKQRVRDQIMADDFTRLTADIQEAGTVEVYTGPFDRKISGNHVALSGIQRVFTYADSSDYWIEFILENKSSAGLTFSIEEVSWSRENQNVKTNLSLLMERVPEYLAPPAGCRYFDTAVYRNYLLGPSGPGSFTFYSRFNVPQSFGDVVKGSDKLMLVLELSKLNTASGHFIVLEKVVLEDMFQYVKHRTIQRFTASEMPKWES